MFQCNQKNLMICKYVDIVYTFLLTLAFYFSDITRLYQGILWT